MSGLHATLRPRPHRRPIPRGHPRLQTNKHDSTSWGSGPPGTLWWPRFSERAPRHPPTSYRRQTASGSHALTASSVWTTTSAAPRGWRRAPALPNVPRWPPRSAGSRPVPSGAATARPRRRRAHRWPEARSCVANWPWIPGQPGPLQCSLAAAAWFPAGTGRVFSLAFCGGGLESSSKGLASGAAQESNGESRVRHQGVFRVRTRMPGA